MQITQGGEIRLTLTKQELQRLLEAVGDSDEIVLRIPMEDAWPLNEQILGHTYKANTLPGEPHRETEFTLEAITLDTFLKTEKP